MTNPPAFPVHFVDREGDLRTEEQGMALRDYFAGQALVGVLSDSDYSKKCLEAAEGSLNTLSFAEIMAKDAYDMADAMLEERQKTK